MSASASAEPTFFERAKLRYAQALGERETKALEHKWRAERPKKEAGLPPTIAIYATVAKVTVRTGLSLESARVGIIPPGHRIKVPPPRPPACARAFLLAHIVCLKLCVLPVPVPSLV
jgi:hypothetical protein